MHENQPIESPRRMSEFCDAIRNEPLIAFDTEFVSEDSYRPELCLVQVAAGEYLAAIDELAAAAADGTLIIGGKSMGGRVASMIADDLFAAGRIAGLLCLGYPFHPIDKPDKLRTEHLKDLKTPTLICQGTRDPFGTSEEVATYDLSPAIQLSWFEDGDHDLKPRKRISGFSHADHMNSMSAAVGAWVEGV